MEQPNNSGSQSLPIRDFQHAESYIIVKAAPRESKKFGETVCIAGLNLDGSWVRLYPVSFRDLKDAQRFGRWDKVKYRWRSPSGRSDLRDESRRVDPNSIQIIGKMPEKDRHGFLNRVAVTSLKKELAEGRSLALLRPEIIEFYIKKKSDEQLSKELEVREILKSQADLFVKENVIPKEPCPFSFHYRYRDDDGEHDGTCQDWETEATFQKRRFEMGEQKAIGWMQEMFGSIYPTKGMALAMGTHRYRTDQWLINGIVRLDDEKQLSLI